MKLREKRWLDERIKEWAVNKLIEPKQARALQAYEAARLSMLGANAFVILATLGGICVALGVILLVSYNWDLIPKELKIANFLLLLIGAGEVSIRLVKRPGAAATGVGILWLMLPLAGIGLYGQVFQLSGDSFKPLLVWLLLSALPVWLMGNSSVVLLHTIGIVAALFVGIFDPNSMITLSNHRQWWWHEGWDGGSKAFVAGWGPALLIIAGMWAFAFWQARRFLGPYSRQALILALLVFLWVPAFDWTVLGAGSLTAWVLPGALAALWWGLQTRLLPAENQGLGWGVLFSSAALYWITFVWHEPVFWQFSNSWPGLAYVALVGVAGILGALDLPEALTSQGTRSLWFLKALILMPLALGLLLMAGLHHQVVGLVANFSLWASLFTWVG
jgi:uncharacterized membrane protein